MTRFFQFAWLLAALQAGPVVAAEYRLAPTGEKIEGSRIAVENVGAGPFRPSLWQRGRLHLVPDSQEPLLEPREGKFRNIYAPSAVQTADGWTIFYGAWDGVDTPNDRIYRVTTRDFIHFGDRETVIEHNAFTHVCNVNAVAEGGGFSMVCTVYPDDLGMNKPAVFRSPDGKHWNGSPAPYPARSSDILRIDGYTNYAKADINGMNVMLKGSGGWRLYFCDFKNFGNVFRAHSADGKSFAWDGVALEGHYAVNDVKQFAYDGKKWFLMGLHMNGNATWYSVSTDGLKFEPARPLLSSRNSSDRYIVSLGFVTSGSESEEGRKLMGVLYGAGDRSSLDHNRIFARWLQKKLVLDGAGGEHTEGRSAMGPDRQIIQMLGPEFLGSIEIYDEDGMTPAGTIPAATLQAGRVYRLEAAAP